MSSLASGNARTHPVTGLPRRSARAARLARARWLAGVLVAPLALTACQPADQEPGAASGTPQLLVAVTATSADPLPALPQEVVSRMHELGSASDQVGSATVATLVGADGEQLPRVPRLHDLTPLRGTKVERIPERREEQVTENVASVTESLGQETSDADGVDLLALLQQAGDLNVTDVVVVSSGVSTVDPLDIRQLGWNRPVKLVVDDLDERGLLPRSLDGKDVTFVGLGSTAGTQARLAGPEQNWVQQLWMSICRRAGAQECRLAEELPAASEPVAVKPVPVVAVPTYDTVTGTQTRPDGACRTLRRLSGDFLFDGGSADVRPGADAELQEIVDEVRSGATITAVAGHTADVDDGDGRDLSLRRAEAVVRRLLDLGIERDQIGEVIGYGEDQEIEPSRKPDGTVDVAAAAQNRRVEITTTNTECEADENGETHD